jgi:hypothetical protein
MAIDIVVTTDRYHSDPNSRSLIEYLQANQEDLAIDSSVLYYVFPLTLTTKPKQSAPTFCCFPHPMGL